MLVLARKEIGRMPRTSAENPPSRTKVDICLPNWQYVCLCVRLCVSIRGDTAPCVVLLWALCRLPYGLWINGGAVGGWISLAIVVLDVCVWLCVFVCVRACIRVKQNHFNPHINTRIYPYGNVWISRFKSETETVICVGMYPVSNYTQTHCRVSARRLFRLHTIMYNIYTHFWITKITNPKADMHVNDLWCLCVANLCTDIKDCKRMEWNGLSKWIGILMFFLQNGWLLE